MLRLQAPAKLNLYLRVLGKRPDGYHELETVFERIDLADELTFEPADTVRLTCNDPSLLCGEDNLILRAARLLQTATGTKRGAAIHLIKRIPTAAGLGGGSSDAATTLLALNRLWNLDLQPQHLTELAAQLGADVPFFLLETSFALGKGRGDACQPLAAPSVELAHVLVVPAVRLSTTEVFSTAEFNLTAKTPSSTMVAHALSNGSLSELAQGLWNDLEPEAIRRCPIISVIQSRLRERGCLGVRLSGSGPSVFGLCRDEAHARDIMSGLRCIAPASWRIEFVRTQRQPMMSRTRFSNPSGNEAAAAT